MVLQLCVLLMCLEEAGGSAFLVRERIAYWLKLISTTSILGSELVPERRMCMGPVESPETCSSLMKIPSLQ